MRPGLSLISALYQKRNAFSLVGIIKSQSLWLGLMLVCMLMYLAHAEALLRYDRALLGQGELWRMFSGQMLHLNWPHYWLNMAGVAIVAIFFNQDLTKRQWLILMLFSSMFISVCLYYFDPGMLWYMGMSGVLHTLFVVGAW